MNRSQLLAGGVASAAVVVAPSSIRAQPKSTAARIGVLATDVSAEPFYAAAGGMFKKVAIEGQMQTLANGGAIIGAVASGSLDVGFANLTSVAAAKDRGLPIAVIAPATLYTAKAPITVLVKARGSKLQRATDLNGKTIAVSTLRGELQVGASAWIDRNGGDAKSVHFLEMPFSAMAPALKASRVDAAMLTEPQLTMQRDEIEVLAPAYDAIGEEFLIGGWVASQAWIKANGDLAKRFAAAMAETARWANGHHAQTAEILGVHAKIEPAVIKAMTRATYGERLTPDTVQPVLDAAARYGALRTPMKAAELIAGSGV